MLMTFDKTAELINSGKLLHIAGTGDLLKKLPKGNWVGGSTEYFMANDGCKVSGDLLFVSVFTYDNFSIKAYDASDINSVAADAYDNGFSIVIVPFDSSVHKEYAENAAGFKDMFIKNIAGWVAGVNLNKPGQSPLTVNGITGDIFTGGAVALHMEVPADKTVSVNILNIFEQDEASPVIEFTEEGFQAKTCVIDGKEWNFAEYISQKSIDTKLPLVGDYSGHGINISFKSIDDDVVNFYAPVFKGIRYRIAKTIPSYEDEFHKQLTKLAEIKSEFTCNCILNFLYCELEGKRVQSEGPITFGEIAYQLVNQTLVYITVV